MSKFTASSSSMTVEADEVLFDGQKWGTVPVSVFSAEVSMGARCLYALLWTYVNPHQEYSAWPSQETLGAQLGISSRMVRKYMKELVDAKLVDKHYKAQLDPEWKGNPSSRLYVIKLPCGTHSSGPSGTHCSGSTGTHSSYKQNKEQTTEQNIVGVVFDFEEPVQELPKIEAQKPENIHPELWQLALKKAKGGDPIAYAEGCLKRGWKPTVKPVHSGNDYLESLEQAGML